MDCRSVACIIYWTRYEKPLIARDAFIKHFQYRFTIVLIKCFADRLFAGYVIWMSSVDFSQVSIDLPYLKPIIDEIEASCCDNSYDLPSSVKVNVKDSNFPVFPKKTTINLITVMKRDKCQSFRLSASNQCSSVFYASRWLFIAVYSRSRWTTLWAKIKLKQLWILENSLR